MDEKRRVLIVDSQEDWLNILRQSFSENEFEVQTSRSYKEASCALDVRQFALAVIDPMVDEARDDADDGIQVLAGLMQRFSELPVIIVTGSAGQSRLGDVSPMPRVAPLIQKQHWDRGEFLAVAHRALSGDQWGPPEPEITLPPGLEASQQTAISPTQYVTGPLHATGRTGPLVTGLMPPPVGSRLGRPRVLIVEDRADWQHIFGQLMDSEDYFWRVASTYEEALERLNLESFHIVLLDLMLDETDLPVHEGKGWRLLEHLVSTWPKTRVIVASGEASPNDVAKLFMRYPIKGFVDKGAFDEAELLAMIHEQLGGPSLRVQTLGDFRIWRDGTPINNFGSERAETVVKFLVTRRGENVSVEELVECLWPGSDPKAVYSDLGTTINAARAALEPDLPRPNDSHFIQRRGSNYMFNFMANVEVDIERLRQLVDEGHQFERSGETDKALRQYEAVRSVYQGDYLPGDRFAQWAIQERSAAQGLYTEALNRMADLYAAEGDLDKAIEAATRSREVDAYIESTYRRLMRYHNCKGDRNAALAVYRALVKLFSEFFGEEPSIATRRLYEDIEAGRTVACVETSPGGEWRAAADRSA